MGLTQEEVALRSDLSQGYINQLESGKRRFTQKSLQQIAKGLNISIVEYIVRGKRLSYKKEVVSLLDELPSRIREHYIALLRLERDLWKKRPA